MDSHSIITSNGKLISVEAFGANSAIGDIDVEGIPDSDNEYVRDYTIRCVNSINWRLILKDLNLPEDVLWECIERLTERYRHSEIFDLTVHYTNYDASIGRIFMRDFAIAHINETIETVTEQHKNEDDLWQH